METQIRILLNYFSSNSKSIKSKTQPVVGHCAVNASLFVTNWSDNFGRKSNNLSKNTQDAKFKNRTTQTMVGRTLAPSPRCERQLGKPRWGATSVMSVMSSFRLGSLLLLVFDIITLWKWEMMTADEERHLWCHLSGQSEWLNGMFSFNEKWICPRVQNML